MALPIVIRHEQSAYVSRIPLEIFAEILSYFEPPPAYHEAIGDLIPDANNLTSRTIKSMSLVCRHFYFHLYPLRLETMFVVNDDANKSKYKLSHCHRFCKAIVDGNARARTLARYVKRCAIGCFNLNDNDAAVEKQLSICAEALSFMTSVHELHIFRTSITNEILNSTLSLPPLKALRLDDCNVPRVLDKKLLRRFSTLRATHIFIRGNFSQSSDKQATDQFLKPLCASYGKTLTCNGTTSFHLLKALVSLGPLEHLTHLHINVLHLAEYKELLPDALSCLPGLKHLHFGEILHWQSNNTTHFDPFMYPDFPKLPNLEYIHAHAPALQVLIPRSRVTTIGIATEKLDLDPVTYSPNNAAFWHTLTAVFQMSQRPICELDVPFMYYRKIDLAAHFPRLRRLKLRVLHINWPFTPYWNGVFTGEHCRVVLKGFLNVWLISPDLTHLEFVTEPLPLKDFTLEDRFLTRLKSKFPSLNSLMFSCPKSHLHGRESERKEYSGPESEIPSP